MVKRCRTLKKLVCVLILPVILVPCEKQDDLLSSGAISTTATVESVSESLAWEKGLKINFLMEDQEDETYLFDSYMFFFSEDGKVTAMDAGKTVNGTYIVLRDDGIKDEFSQYSIFLRA